MGNIHTTGPNCALIVSGKMLVIACHSTSIKVAALLMDLRLGECLFASVCAAESRLLAGLTSHAKAAIVCNSNQLPYFTWK